uniref:NADH-ubiquinone oxidoreductase chain 3 n=1 Tax=Reclinomonas americana TaxID=48483 RepID=NU3M_RECAM|nr:NADH dehydrogenase subunit 3 [Reclinomonas americana]O21273.1 RecName: Full=NADH-ubiquinone oxidoreductase chain 3; AltName: Full=NADH dehydrogenase subunit 3 [Reclinomonas americana]AAD11900.1 NADH dehydrogenase subunit 3 [Reclinomonas americana]
MNTMILSEYLSVLIFFIFSFGLSCIILGLSYVLATQNADTEKLSPYECGFNPFDDARGAFDVRFYLVAILFIIFDLEVAFLFPWAVALSDVTIFGFWTMFIFLLILTVGFIYEWKKGALDWE